MRQQRAETCEVTLNDETSAGLADLARDTHRDAASLAAEAIAEFVEREKKIVAAIHRGLDDVKAGRTVPHDVAIREIREAINRVRRT